MSNLNNKSAGYEEANKKENQAREGELRKAVDYRAKAYGVVARHATYLTLATTPWYPAFMSPQIVATNGLTPVIVVQPYSLHERLRNFLCDVDTTAARKIWNNAKQENPR